eukprot:765902-Hanusia_phi.AAC.1
MSGMLLGSGEKRAKRIDDVADVRLLAQPRLHLQEPRGVGLSFRHAGIPVYFDWIKYISPMRYRSLNCLLLFIPSLLISPSPSAVPSPSPPQPPPPPPSASPLTIFVASKPSCSTSTPVAVVLSSCKPLTSSRTEAQVRRQRARRKIRLSPRAGSMSGSSLPS